MDDVRRVQILKAYVRQTKRFDEIALRRHHSLHPFHVSESASAASGTDGGYEPEPVPLSPRQQEVLELIAAGLPNGEIGTTLVLSIETVKTHVQGILRNLGARNRAHAVFIASGRPLLGQPTPPTRRSA